MNPRNAEQFEPFAAVFTHGYGGQWECRILKDELPLVHPSQVKICTEGNGVMKAFARMPGSIDGDAQVVFSHIGYERWQCELLKQSPGEVYEDDVDAYGEDDTIDGAFDRAYVQVREARCHA